MDKGHERIINRRIKNNEGMPGPSTLPLDGDLPWEFHTLQVDSLLS